MPYTIVLADPSPSVQKAAQLVFAEPEFRLSVFEDGASLVEAAADLRPDALVVSLTLPGRDGYEVGRILRSRKELAAIPLVGLKGTFESMDAETARAGRIRRGRPQAVRFGAAGRGRPGAHRPEDGPAVPARGPALARRRERPAGRTAAPPAAASGPEIKAIVHEEIVGMEREIEKRVRASVLAELKEWMSKP